MSQFEDKLDFEILQAKWVLGGVEPEQLVQAALSTLERGFAGVALSQLAGLTNPTSRDLGALAARAFAELGFKPIGQNEAVSLLVEHDEPRTNPVINDLRRAFPDFSDRWRRYVAEYRGESCGSYIDISEFVHFVVEDLYEKGNLGEAGRVFAELERHLAGADEETSNLIALGFFETLQCYASWRKGGNQVYEQFLGPTSKEIWIELKEIWAGKSSLADVVRAERRANKGESS
jgi:hypothetical protein